MLRTIEAIIEDDGSVRLLEEVELPRGRRALVTILEDAHDVALLSEAALAEDWDREDEDRAWQHLQQAR